MMWNAKDLEDFLAEEEQSRQIERRGQPQAQPEKSMRGHFYHITSGTPSGAPSQIDLGVVVASKAEAGTHPPKAGQHPIEHRRSIGHCADGGKADAPPNNNRRK